jgi:hypothetical protein
VWGEDKKDEEWTDGCKLIPDGSNRQQDVVVAAEALDQEEWPEFTNELLAAPLQVRIK